jgi:hypothetical protein
MGRGAPLLIRLRPAWLAGSLAARYAVDHDSSGDMHRCALALVDELIAFSDSSAGIPSHPGELLAPAVAPRPGAGLGSAIEGARRELR